jgi:3-hydroxybutyryl-CoA dehydrogenase
MSTHHTEQLPGSRFIAVTGDDELTGVIIPLLESCGFIILSAHDARAIRSAGAAVTAGLELSMSHTDTKKERLVFLDEHVPPSAPIVTASVMITAAAQAGWMRHPERLIGWSAFPTLMDGPLAEIAIPVGTKTAAVKAARALFDELGKETVSVQDRVGMILPCVVAQVINEALFVVQQNVTSPEEVDMAMKTGAGYPLGPIEWGEKIGFANIVRLLDAMRFESGEDRYRTAPLLRQLSLSGIFWKTKAVEPVQEELPLGDIPLDTADSHSPVRDEKEKKRRTKKSPRPH